MAAPDVKQLLALDLATRLTLVAQLWDSIVQDASTGATLPISAAEQVVLEQRLREDDEAPAAAIPWSRARAQLRTR